MIVQWSVHAADDLEHIFRHVGQTDPLAARTIVQEIYLACGGLMTFPHRGRIGRIYGTRELIFISLPYIAVYRVGSEAVHILRVYHSAQNWP
jgi:plasmid stabilization system protein ParE